MPRPRCCRLVAVRPDADFFKPRGVPLCRLEVIQLALDELEALRLADGEGLEQSAAAAQMGVSRQTLGRILETARHKLAEALVQGKAIEFVSNDSVRIVGRRRCGRSPMTKETK
jgi:uncharacterized protein